MVVTNRDRDRTGRLRGSVVNYEEARQIGPNGPAPGKWNWSNFNDTVQDAPFTAAPCAWPDFESGRRRCDHDTREEAERHHWEYEVARVQFHRLDLDTLRGRQRCDVPECQNWEDYRTSWPGGFRSDALCTGHANREGVTTIHPFVPGMQSIHS